MTGRGPLRRERRRAQLRAISLALALAVLATLLVTAFLAVRDPEQAPARSLSVGDCQPATQEEVLPCPRPSAPSSWA